MTRTQAAAVLIGSLVLLALTFAMLLTPSRQTRANPELAGSMLNELASSTLQSNEVDWPAITADAQHWIESQTQPLVLTITDDAGGVSTISNTDPDTISAPLQAAELSVLHNGRVAGRLQLALYAPHATSHSSPVISRTIPLVVAISLLALLHAKRRSSSFGAAWSDARSRVAHTLNFLSAGVLILDSRGRLVFANDSMVRSLALSSGTPGLGINALPWLSSTSDSSSRASPKWQDVVTGSASCTRSVVSLRDATGAVRTYNAACMPITARSRVIGVLVTLDDVTILTEQKRELAAARTDADRANQAKSTFLANMSHEIRTPLNGVIGALTFLEETQLEPRQRRFMDAASTSANSLLHLINDILDFSKIEAGKLELCSMEFDLERCLSDALAVVAPAAAAKGIDLILNYQDVPRRVLRGDPDRLRQVLINLTGNAVKFTSKGEVECAATFDPTEGRLCISIRDTGIGIPPDRLDRLFRSFSQVDESTSRTYGGTGLGLAISRQLVHLMGGDIRVESTPGVGSVFHFDVSLASVGAPTLLRTVLAESVVIVVEACEAAANATASALRHTGLRVFTAPDLDHAHHAVAATRASNVRRVLLIGCIEWNDAWTDSVLALSESDPDLVVCAHTMRPVPFATERRLERAVRVWLSKPTCPTDLTESLLILTGGTSDSSPDTRQVLDPELVKNVRVLVAEDNPVGQLITSEFLRSIGIESDIAETGPKAVAMARDGTHTLILMDCHLPELDGYEATRQIRQHEQSLSRHPATIIALTASAMAGDRERCLHAGMDGYLTKPIHKDALAKVLAAALGARLVPSPPAHDAHTERDEGAEASSPLPAPVGDSLPADPPISIDVLSERCLNDRAIAVQLLNLFERATLDDLDRIAAAAQEGLVEAIGEIAHSIAGSSLQVGAERLASIAREIERAPSKAISGDHAMLEALRQEFTRCRTHISSSSDLSHAP